VLLRVRVISRHQLVWERGHYVQEEGAIQYVVYSDPLDLVHSFKGFLIFVSSQEILNDLKAE